MSDKIAFALFLAEWNHEDDQWATDTKHLLAVWKTWKENQRYLNEPHQGDCIKEPMACMRCFIESFVNAAKKIEELG